jgi:hypothetical protein
MFEMVDHVINALGLGSLVTGFILQAGKFFNIFPINEINDAVTFVTVVGGCVWIWMKVYQQRLETKKFKREQKKKEKEDE